MIWTVPNILTFSRVAAAPMVALVFALLERPIADLVAFALFMSASATDFMDGWLARRWNQVTALGKMLDPIADKAMVIIALAVLMAVAGLHWAMLAPVSLILLREVAVSGLREFLGNEFKLPVTRLAKWKTTAQMFAIGTLFLAGWADETLAGLMRELPPQTAGAILTGAAQDTVGLRFWHALAPAGWAAGYALLWVAAGMTLISGWDYMARGVAFIRAREGRG
nr:CDP-diacylglycerol--glycerol-3-phosphate 3-phosphatidyltransferase [Oceanicella actignis]